MNDQPLRVAHVVTLVTPTGAYGGPVRVATNVITELNRRGLRSVLWGGCAGFASPQDSVDAAPAALDSALVPPPRFGFAATVAPGVLLRIWRNRRDIDCLHIHLARDLVTMPAALLARMLRIPYLAQTHGMIAPKKSIVAQLFDTAFTRPALRNAKTIFYLTGYEKHQLLDVVPALRQLRRLGNGVPLVDGDTRRARAGASEVEFLFLARLHQRKRPLTFVEAAAHLLDEGVEARFAIVGPDGGEEQSVHAAIEKSGWADRIWLEGPLAPEHTAERMSRSDVYVLPSVDEPYPMSVLEAMAVGLPVVITESCGLADAVWGGKAGHVVDESVAALTDALRRLAEDSRHRSDLGQNAARLVRQRFSMASVGDSLSAAYEAAVG